MFPNRETARKRYDLGVLGSFIEAEHVHTPARAPEMFAARNAILNINPSMNRE